MSLAGRRVVVTRDEGPDGPLSAALRSRGAEPVLRSALTFRFAGPDTEFGRAVSRLDDYDWLVLTSARTVRALAGVHGFAQPRPERLRIAAVGPGTARAVEAQGWGVDLAPASGGGAALVGLLEDAVSRGRRVLLPASEAATTDVADRLSDMGCDVTSVVAYGPEPRPQDADRWAEDLADHAVDAITFTSPSALHALEHGLGVELLNRVRSLPAGAQGPTTATALRDAGWTSVVEAGRTTFDGLSDSLDRWFGDDA